MRFFAVLCALLLFSTSVAARDKTMRKGIDLSFSGNPKVEKPKFAGRNSAALRPPAGDLRICSWNIEHFTDGHDDWVKKTPARSKKQAKHAAQILAGINPTILFVEEIENLAMVERLNRSMDKPFPFACITDFGDVRERDVSQNIALFSRVQVKGLRELDFEGTSGAGRPPRGALSCFVELGDNRRLLLYGVHLKANVGKPRENYSKRWNALRLVRADADNLKKNYPKYTWEVVIMGDMNVDPESKNFGDDPTFQPVIDWVDLWLGRPIAERTTIPTRYGGGRQWPPQGFDRFIVSPELMRSPWKASSPRVEKKGINTRDAEAEPGYTIEHVSDHYPIYMDIEMGKASGGEGKKRTRGLLDSVK